MNRQVWLGAAAVIGAVIAIAGNTVGMTATSEGNADLVRGSISSDIYPVAQMAFAATQALFALGVLGVVRVLNRGGGRVVRVFGMLAVTGLALTAVGELVLIPIGDAPVTGDIASAASSVFGIGLLVGGVGLVGAAIGALRRRDRHRLLAGLAIAWPVWTLGVVTPVSFGFGFGSPPSRIAIVAADLLIAAMGVVVIVGGRRVVPPSEVAATQHA